MGVESTQSRQVVGQRCLTYQNGIEIGNYDVYNAMGINALAKQVTTSYRSGRSLGLRGEREDVEGLTTEAKSQIDFISRIQDESRSGPRSRYDTGHAFSTSKRYLGPLPQIDDTSMAGSVKYRYVGPVVSQQSYHAAGTFVTPTPWGNPSVYGAKAIAATAPTNPVTNLGRALGELRKDGLPHLPGIDLLRRAGKFSYIGDQFLNWKFGIAPTAQDLASLIDAVAEAKRLLQQYQRDSGRLVRRSFTFPVEKSVTNYPASAGRVMCLSSTSATKPWLGSNTGLADGQLTESVTIIDRIRFAGAYTYHLPIGRSAISRIDKMLSQVDHLLGIKLTPELVWQLTSWTWLIDWVVDIGAILHNIDLFSHDSLVLQYGYIMRERIATHDCSIAGPVLKTGRTGPWNTSFITHSKERVQANPYGFGLLSSFTNQQWSILAALGMTRGDKRLR